MDWEVKDCWGREEGWVNRIAYGLPPDGWPTWLPCWRTKPLSNGLHVLDRSVSVSQGEGGEGRKEKKIPGRKARCNEAMGRGKGAVCLQANDPPPSFSTGEVARG